MPKLREFWKGYERAKDEWKTEYTASYADNDQIGKELLEKVWKTMADYVLPKGNNKMATLWGYEETRDESTEKRAVVRSVENGFILEARCKTWIFKTLPQLIAFLAKENF